MVKPSFLSIVAIPEIALKKTKISKFNLKKLMMTLPLGAMAASLAMPSVGYALEFPDTGDRGAPSSTAGGGTRGGWCEENVTWADTSLQALAPKNNVITFAGDQASLWLHASDIFEQKTAEIFVQNADTQAVIYEAQLQLEGLEPGKLIKVDLPATTATGEPLLEKGKTYTWEFAIICSTGDRTQDYYVNGLLEPVEIETELSAKLETASPEEQAELYASAGIWQETLMLAEQLSPSMPMLLPELLRSVGLSELPQAQAVEAAEATEGSV